MVEHLVYTERVGGSNPSPPRARDRRSITDERRLALLLLRRKTAVEADVSAANEEMQATRLPATAREDTRRYNFPV